MIYLAFLCVTTLGIQMANTQGFRPPPMPYNPAVSLLNRAFPRPEPFIEPNNCLPPQPVFNPQQTLFNPQPTVFNPLPTVFNPLPTVFNPQPTVFNPQPTLCNPQPPVFSPQPTVISEPPCNSLVPIPDVVSEPVTTLITDCSPTICKNLANTIELMIVCNLLQNNRGNSEATLQLAAPIINEVLSSSTLACGCCNTLSPNVISPSVVSPSVVSPIISPCALSPRVVSPNVCPNSQVNTNNLINTLMGLLDNIQG